MKTFSAKPGEFVRTWFVIDAADQVLGRLASRAAIVLRGKHKPVYTPHADTGDFVIVINAEKVKLTGNKLDGKMYVRHSEYPGGLTQVPYRRLLATHPERAIEHAVKGMLPHNILGRNQMRKLKVYKGAAHPHESQKPEPLSVDGPIPVTVERVPPRTPAPRGPKTKAKAKAKPATSKATGGRKPAARKPKPAAKPAPEAKPTEAAPEAATETDKES
jgi:large subunit ribosomal protein L13